MAWGTGLEKNIISQFYLFVGTQIGMNNTKAIIENNNPPIVPTAKANQNTSLLPSKRNGIKPKTVERIVKRIGIILWL